MLHAKIYLPNPIKGEKIEMILHRHSLIMFGNALLFIVLLSIPWVFKFFIAPQFQEIWNDKFIHPIIFMAGSIYLLYILLFFYSNFIDYWLDVWVISNERIISVEQKGLFARTFAESKLYRLQDVSSKIEGFLPTMFHYGDVVVQISTSTQNAVIHQVDHADLIARKIMELAEECKERHENDLMEHLEKD